MNNTILVTQSSMPPFAEYVEEIQSMWESHWLTNMGPKHRLLQAQLAAYLGVAGIDLLTNGHMALELAIQALGLTGEVITTPFTFASTTQAIVRGGCTPVFCDIDPVDFTLDVSQIEGLITEKTTAILPVHVYGNVCRVEELDRIAKKHNLKLIYDAAHTFGERYKGQGLGSFGDISCFSFHATKVFNTIEGGAVCFREAEIGQRIARLKNFGIEGEAVPDVGTNAKLNEFCAAMGLCNLRHVDQEIAKRKEVVQRYRERLEGVPGLQLAPVQEGLQSNYAYFPAVFDEAIFGVNRDAVLAALSQQGINARKYFYPTTNSFTCYGGRFDPQQTPVALSISQRVLTLPLYAELALEDIDRICAVILGLRR